MPLKILSSQDEPTQFFEEDPKFETFRDCIYAPIKSNEEWGRNFWENKHWGLYDRDGNLIESATFRYSPERALQGQNETCLHPLSAIQYAPGDLYFYLGNFINHYGHFVCSSMARIWGLGKSDLSKVSILGHAEGRPSDWFSWSWVPPMLAASGIAEQDFASFDRPVRLREVIVPAPSLVERTLVHQVYAKSMNRVGDRLAKNAPQQSWRDVVYLSKEGVGDANVSAYFSNEGALVEQLKSLGASIIHPEALSLREQVLLFRTTRCIIAPCGSALHTSIFSEPRDGQTIISLVDKPSTFNSTHAMFDHANGTRTTYVYLDAERHHREHARPELRLLDPRAAASALFEMAHQHAS